MDFVEVWVGGRTLSSSRLIRRLSGSTLPSDNYLLSYNNMAIVRFVSDQTRHHTGFKLKWRAGLYRVISLGNFYMSLCLMFDCLGWKERKGNVLFNDTLNSFYLRLYDVRHMVKDHSDSERKPTAATWATLSD